MNLNNHPTKDQLRELLGGVDDAEAHHVLWVAKNGEVYLSTLQADQTPVGFEESHPDLQVRFETFQAGNEYVGPEAAYDDEWVSELYANLLDQWQKGMGKPTSVYVDMI